MQPPSHTVRAQDSLSTMSVPIISSSMCSHAEVFCRQGDMTGHMANAKTGMKRYYPKNCSAPCRSPDATEPCEPYSPRHRVWADGIAALQHFCHAVRHVLCSLSPRLCQTPVQHRHRGTKCYFKAEFIAWWTGNWISHSFAKVVCTRYIFFSACNSHFDFKAAGSFVVCVINLT